MNAETQRLKEARDGKAEWKKWGPYLAERQWGTVREDYSEGGRAWDYFTHDQARSRAYRRGEDGLAGISDSKQRLCFALALCNGRDPILKERLFGLTNRKRTPHDIYIAMARQRCCSRRTRQTRSVYSAFQAPPRSSRTGSTASSCMAVPTP